jgi:hypothetical protein
MKIKVYTLLIDDQDGNFTFNAFKTKKERDDVMKEKGWSGKQADHSGYDYGYPGEEYIVVEEVKGKLVLAEPFEIST